MEENENRVKSRRSIPILSRKYLVNLKSANTATTTTTKNEKRSERQRNVAQSLASSQASFAAGLRVKTTHPKPSRTVSGNCGAQTPGWRAKFLTTPKSILKSKTLNPSKTTGHKGKALKDSTNRPTDGNKRHVSLKLDFKYVNKTAGSQGRQGASAGNTKIVKSPGLTDRIRNKVVEEQTDSCGEGTDKVKGLNDSSLLSDIQSLSLDNSDMTDNKENETPGTSTPDMLEVVKHDNLSSNKDVGNPINVDKVPLKQRALNGKGIGPKTDKHVTEKSKKTLSRSATFTSGASLSKRNVKSANESSKQFGGYSRGIRR
jgi:hypothetical protein